MWVGLIAVGFYFRRTYGAFLPVATVVRVGLCFGATIAAGRFLPAGGKVIMLAECAALAPLYVVLLFATRELTVAEIGRFASVLKRKGKS